MQVQTILPAPSPGQRGGCNRRGTWRRIAKATYHLRNDIRRNSPTGSTCSCLSPPYTLGCITSWCLQSTQCAAKCPAIRGPRRTRLRVILSTRQTDGRVTRVELVTVNVSLARQTPARSLSPTVVSGDWSTRQGDFD